MKCGSFLIVVNKNVKIITHLPVEGNYKRRMVFNNIFHPLSRSGVVTGGGLKWFGFSAE